MAEPIFQLKDVTYRYPTGETALEGIDLTIYEGEKVALLGANGSGKSTLLKILDCLLFPQKGSFTAFGRAISEEALKDEEFSFAFRRRVGFVFQNSDAQLFNSSVWEEIAFGPVQLGLPREEVERRVEDVMRMLGIEHLRHRPPFKLSGGEKKKVAIASVLSINPAVLLFDEPTSGLDPRTQRWLINLIRSLNAAGKTIVTATHDLDIVDQIADRAVVLGEDHRIAAEGSVEEVLEDLDLLLRVNLIDEEFHRHLHQDGHRHFHAHS
ncbi:MAG: energy-coupling factor ABC transporter ATP-binding protein [Thermacetogeniaceae bacterium]